MESIITKKDHYQTGPRQQGIGNVVVLPIRIDAQTLDLRSVGAFYAGTITANLPVDLSNNLAAQAQAGVVDQFIFIYPDGADLCWTLGPTADSVSGANAPDPTQIGFVDPITGIYGEVQLGPLGQCGIIPSNPYPFAKVYLVPTQDLFIGFVGRNFSPMVANPTVRIYQANFPRP